MINLFRFVGWRHLQLKPFRTLLTIVGVALGMALFVAIHIINQSTLASFKENVEAVTGKAKLIVSAGEAGFPEEKLELIQKVKLVKSAVPMIESRAYYTRPDGTTETLMILGVDMLKEQAVRTYKTTDEEVIDDPLVFLNQPDSLIVTHHFAKQNGLQLNSTLEMNTAHGVQKFTVRGMLTPEGPAKAYGGSIALMDIDGARMTFGKENKIDRVDIVPKTDSNLEDVIAAIEAQLGKGYRVERPESQSQGMERMVQSYQLMMTFFSSMALLVGLFLVTNSMSISVAERKREIGTLRALGATRRGILSLFISEAFVIGTIGGGLGALLGRGIAAILSGYMEKTMTTQYLTRVQITRLAFGWESVLQAMALGAFASVVAAGWPSFQATRIQPLEAMRKKELGEDDQKTSFYRMSPWMGLTLLFWVTLSTTLQLQTKYSFLEQINQACSIVSAALLGPGIVTVLIHATRRFLGKRTSVVARLAQDNILRNPKRTSANVMSLMVGLVLVILVAAVNVSFKATIVGWFDRIMTADIIVSSNGQVISYQVQPLNEKIGQEIDRIPGVLVDEIQGMKVGSYGLRFIHVRYGDKQLGVKASDEPPASLNYSNLDVMDRPAKEAGYELYHSKVPAVMVSENFVLHYGKKTGDWIELETPSGLVSFKIIGVVVDYASNVGVLHIDRKTYREVWKDPLVNAFGVQVKAGYDVDQVRRQIINHLGPSKNLMAISNLEMKNQMVELIDESFANAYAIELAALLVGLLGLLNTLFISVMERMRELGMLRAVGMSRKQVTAMIFQEAFFQGGFGAVTAILIGGWLAYIWITYSLSHVLGWVIHFSYPWSSIGVTLLAGLTVAWIAGYFPARKAGAINISEALDYE